MKTLYLLIAIYVALIVSGCASTLNTATETSSTSQDQSSIPPPKCHHKKDPISVSFLINQKLGRPYKVLGKTKVSKYNLVGIKRQEATLRDLMRQQAAMLGGDAIINIQHDKKSISATVIAYKRVLV